MSLISLPFAVHADDGTRVALTPEMLAGHGITTTNAPVKNQPFLPAAFRRLELWGGINFPVYFITVADDSVHVRTGRIIKMPDARVGVPKQATIQFDVWDSSSKSSIVDVEVGDPHLFLITEIGLLRFPPFVDVWFGKMYPPEIIAKIRQAAKEIRLPVALSAETEGQDWTED